MTANDVNNDVNIGTENDANNVQSSEIPPTGTVIPPPTAVPSIPPTVAPSEIPPTDTYTYLLQTLTFLLLRTFTFLLSVCYWFPIVYLVARGFKKGNFAFPLI